VGDLGDATPSSVAMVLTMQLPATRLVEVVVRIATEWNADKAFVGLSNALQAHPDINLLVISSDFLTPQIEQALRTAQAGGLQQTDSTI
jgi:ABC-type sugar transport system substrate-binding protein